MFQTNRTIVNIHATRKKEGEKDEKEEEVDGERERRGRRSERKGSWQV